MKATIGHWVESEYAADFDIETLISSRALICANSGGGKSYGLRKTVEAMAGRVQQIFIDTDGEFASLREKYDFVICSAKGGDAVAHPKTAALLCRRLMETKVSAIIDISELKVPERHLFVKLFIEALMTVGRDLWGPLVVYLDEAHIYCPEGGQGASIAADAVIDLASRGRKRGFCLIAATQRLAKLRKDAAAELLNRLIGRTGLDLDVKRAAFDLGMSPREAQVSLPNLEPGQFYAFGPAISKVVTLLAIDKAQTTHPKAGAARVKELPKPTKAITSVLPQLADLQHEAEEEARTLQEIRAELTRTKRDLGEAIRQLNVLSTKPVAKADPAKVQELRKRVTLLEKSNRALLKLTGEGHKWMHRVANDAQDFAEAIAKTSARYRAFMDPQIAQAHSIMDVEADPEPAQPVQKERPQKVLALAAPMQREYGTCNPDSLPAVQQRILNALAWLEHKGISAPTRPMLSAVAKCRGGYFKNTLGAMHTAGLIKAASGTVSLTEGGAQLALAPKDDGRELWEHWMDVMEGAQKRILKALLDAGVPMSREDLSEASGCRGGYYKNTLGAMHTMGCIEYPEKGVVFVTRNVLP